MNVQLLRFWGMVTGSALIGFALWMVALGPEAPRAGASTGAPAHLAPIENPVPSSFLVRFRGAGPIARAQSDAAQGRTAQAQARIEAQLRRQRAFAGLCFDRFTAGAAEVVLRTCGPVTARERAGLEFGWIARLRAMGAVAYADVNVAAHGRAPG